jgi:hypothetical protein
MLKIFRNISLEPDHFNKEFDDLVFDLYLGPNVEDDACYSHFTPPTFLFFSLLRIFIKNQTFPTSVKEILDKWGSKKVAVLNAHGGMKDGRWVYTDYDGEIYTIQSWIDEQDVLDYGLLIVDCCNRERIRPTVRKTPIFYAEGVIPILDPNANYEPKLILPVIYR